MNNLSTIVEFLDQNNNNYPLNISQVLENKLKQKKNGKCYIFISTLKGTENKN